MPRTSDADLADSLAREAKIRKWNLFFVFANVVILVLAASLISLIVSLEGYWNFFYPFLSIYNEFHGMGIIFAGATVIVCVIFGFTILCTKRSSHYIWFGLSLMLVLIIDTKVIISGMINDEALVRYVEKSFQNGVRMYSNDTYLKNKVDNVQLSLMCCGVNSYTDWLNTTTNYVPYSCCPFSSPTNPNIDGKCRNFTHPNFFREPCIPKLASVPDLGMILIYCIVGCLISLKVLVMILAYKLEGLYKYL